MHVECGRCVEQTASKVCKATCNSTVATRNCDQVDTGCLMSCLSDKACTVFCTLAVAKF